VPLHVKTPPTNGCAAGVKSVGSWAAAAQLQLVADSNKAFLAPTLFDTLTSACLDVGSCDKLSCVCLYCQIQSSSVKLTKPQTL
jgi:hypothetical protein